MPKIPDGSAVLANNSTQVLVAPINNPSTKKNQRLSEGRKSPALDENLGFRDPISSFLCQKTVCPSRFMRVLPKSLVNIEDCQLPSFTLVTISKGWILENGL